MRHASHPNVAKRLKSAHGHLAQVGLVTEAARPCVEIAQRLPVVTIAFSKTKEALIHDHAEQYLADAANTPVDRSVQIAGFRYVTRYL